MIAKSLTALAIASSLASVSASALKLRTCFPQWPLISRLLIEALFRNSVWRVTQTGVLLKWPGISWT